jgi:glyoxylase-like metal-dependent hydrolase (beta-lactamase superfamily II)
VGADHQRWNHHHRHYYYASEPEIIDGLKKVGRDPAKIKYVLITHGHNDHDQGAKMLQDRYGARVALGGSLDLFCSAGGGSWPDSELCAMALAAQLVIRVPENAR